MVSIITFKFLRDLQKKERDSSTLTAIPDDFYDAAKDYLLRKQRLSMRDSMKSFTSLKEIENMRPVIKYIFNRREQKIMTCAIRAARSNNMKLENTTKEEKELFESLKNLLKKRRTFLEDIIVLDETEDIESLIIKKEDNIQKKSIESNACDNNSTNKNSNDDIEFIKIEILEEISEFIAEDMESYGPWNPGEIVMSPKKVANIFIGAKKAKLVE